MTSVPTAAAARLSPGAARLALVALALVFVAATTPTFSLDSSQEGRSDVPNYVPIAEAAPGLPDEDIGSAYTDRFAPHWAVGVLADATGLSIEAAYGVAVIAVALALLLVLHVLFTGLGLGLGGYALCMGLVVLNPYALRPYAMETGRIQDLVLVLGLAVCLLGLLRVRPALVLGGLALGLLGRQTMLLVAPVAGLWVLAGPGWRHGDGPRNVSIAFGALALVLGLFAAIDAITASFTTPFEPTVPADTVLARLDELPGIAPDLVAHAGRTVVALILAAAVLAAAAVARGRGRPSVPATAWWCLAVAAIVLAQPLGLDPDFPGFRSNEQRTGALALVPAVVALAVLLTAGSRGPARWSRAAAAALALLLALGSLHHVFTRPDLPSLGAFIVVQLLVAAGLAALVRRVSWRTAQPG